MMRNQKGRIEFSSVGRLILAGITVFILGMALALSYGWSLGETRKVSQAATGAGGFQLLWVFVSYGLAAALLIQLMPQVLLTFRGLTDPESGEHLFSDEIRKYLLYGAIGFNLVDMLTNIVAVIALGPPNRGSAVLDVTTWVVRILLAVGVTWVEELVLVGVGGVLHLIYITVPGAPAFFRGGMAFALAQSGTDGTRFDPRSRTNRSQAATNPGQTRTPRSRDFTIRERK